ncbi:hypothetical protein [Halosimplex salinum]|uniref:hypothetical protein n=1 Tax=Halosimplex salinum TaxID=1710538 RepID=UPI000F47C9B3|nr:hypothetical protein [Halosimplex salinum]
MDDTAIQNKLDGITLLLLLTVSLLSGLVFGSNSGEQTVFAAVSFVVVALLMMVVSYTQPSPTE